MNRIDKRFKEVVAEVTRKSKEEIFNQIKETYNTKPSEIKIALENYFKKFGYWGKLEEYRG